jgi:hypothetical protein
MKEIFSKEFKEFMEKNKQNSSVCKAKTLEYHLREDPRWAPEILKDCPHQHSNGGGFACSYEKFGNELEPCDGADRCNILKRVA